MKRKHKKLGELHASHEKDITRKRVLRQLSQINGLKILCVVLNKKKVYVDLQNQKNHLYNYTANILLDRLYNSGALNSKEPMHLFFAGSRFYFLGDIP